MMMEFLFQPGGEGVTPVSEKHFGANILATHNEVGPGAEFSHLIAVLGLQTVRYPGGALTERHFDISNPDATRSRTDPSLDGLLGVSEFLHWARAENISVTFVLPTANLLHGSVDPNGPPRMLDTDQFEATKDFVRALITPGDDRFPDAAITAFEIGNEYWGSGEMTSTEYGIIANAMVDALSEVFAEVNPDTVPQLLVQMGSPWGAEFDPGGPYNDQTRQQNDQAPISWGQKVTISNVDIITQITPQNRDQIDGIVEHYYFRGTDDAFSGSSSELSNIDRDLQVWQTADGFGDLDLHITEWNVKANNLAQAGLKGAGVLLEQFETMLRLGVDAAHVWPLVQNTRNALARKDDGEIETLSFLGEAYQMMAQTLVGTKRIDSNISGGPLEVNAYIASDRAVFTIASRSEGLQTYQLDFSAALGSVDHVFGTLLGIDAAGSFTDFDDHRATPLRTALDTDQHWLEGQVSLILDAYEIAQIVFVYDQTLMGGAGADDLTGGMGDDTINAGSGDDLLSGADGNDRLRGHRGKDTLIGGEGQDLLSGGDDDDHLFGGAGDDVLHGQRGRDVLDGGSGIDRIAGFTGDDHLFGGIGNDVLDGGSGNDIVTGGAGADTFVFRANDGAFDKITDFSPSEDRLQFKISALQSFDDLNFHAAPGSDSIEGLVVDYGSGAIFLSGLSLSDADMLEIVFV